MTPMFTTPGAHTRDAPTRQPALVDRLTVMEKSYAHNPVCAPPSRPPAKTLSHLNLAQACLISYKPQILIPYV
jgi:hypothetical protein